jgi:hypothetical protein
MRAIALLVSSIYQLLSEATPRTIVGTEGTIKVLLPEYQANKYFNILNNCAIQNCMPFSDRFPVYLISAFLKLIHFHVCLFEEEINNKQKTKNKHFFIKFVHFCMDIDICPLLESDGIIPLYMSFNLNQ